MTNPTETRTQAIDRLIRRPGINAARVADLRALQIDDICDVLRGGDETLDQAIKRARLQEALDNSGPDGPTVAEAIAHASESLEAEDTPHDKAIVVQVMGLTK